MALVAAGAGRVLGIAHAGELAPVRLVVVAGAQRQPRQMAGTGAGDADLGRTHRVFGGAQRRVLRDRRVDPALGVATGRDLRLEVLGQRAQVAHRRAGDLGQRLVGILQRIAAQDHLGAGGVILRARLVHVGDRRQADFQPAAGEVELLLQRLFGGFGGGQGLDRDQHVEVGRRGAGDQVLVRGLQVEAGGGVELALRAQVGDLAEVEHGLVEAGADAARALVAVGTGHVATRKIHAAADLRQQLRACLHRALARDVALRLRDRQLRIAGACQFIGLHQVLGEGRGGQQHEGQGKGEGTAQHGRSLASVEGRRLRAPALQSAPVWRRLLDQNWNSATGSVPAR